jgi:hypothetical protein
MPLETWVARFVVDHGRVTEEGGLLRTFQRRRLDEPDVDLHILAEPSGEKGAELGSQALDAIGRLFLQDRLSLTGGLSRALASTNQTLLEWNRRSLPRDQVSAGITAVIVSDAALYLAQTGPSLVYLYRQGALQRLDGTEESLTPLGAGDIEPALRRVELAPGDILLGSSLVLDSIVDFRTLAALLSRGSDEALPELYLLTRDLPSFTLFAVTPFQPEDDETAASEDEAHAAIPNPHPPTPIPRTPPPESRSAVERESPPGPVLLAPLPLDISRPVVRLRSDQAIGRSAYTRTTGPTPRFNLNLDDWRLIRYAAAVILVLLVIAFVPDLVRRGRTEKLDDLVASAQSQFAAVAAAADAGERRLRLEETRRLASEALRIDPESVTAGELLQQATARLSEMDAVFDLGPLATVTTLGRQITGQVSVERLVVAAQTAYLLDGKGRRVIAVPLAPGGAPATIFEDGESYAGTPAKEPIYFAWESNAVGGRLLILDAERKLFAVRPASQPEPLPLRRTNSWASVGGIASYDTNLYVLDPKGNQVHRYLPAASGFDSEPTSTLTGQRNLGQAQGLAVNGDIYVFFKNGAVQRFDAEGDAGFDLGGIDRPLKAASDLVIVAATGEVYVADSGNKRVVVAGEDGTFRRQLVSNAFTDLRAIAIDATAGQLYVVVGDALLTAPLVR